MENNKAKPITPNDLTEQWRQAGVSTFHCVVCQSDKVSIIGTDDLLYFFGWPAKVMKTKPLDSAFSVAVAVCDRCGFIHPFSLHPSANPLTKDQEHE